MRDEEGGGGWWCLFALVRFFLPLSGGADCCVCAAVVVGVPGLIGDSFFWIGIHLREVLSAATQHRGCVVVLFFCALLFMSSVSATVDYGPVHGAVKNWHG